MSQLLENWFTYLTIGLVGTGLSAVAVFPVLVRLGQFPYEIIDKGAGVFRSHLASWRMTRGHAATVFLSYLAHLTITLAGLLTFCAGLFLTLPGTNLLLAVTYDARRAKPRRRTRHTLTANRWTPVDEDRSESRG